MCIYIIPGGFGVVFHIFGHYYGRTRIQDAGVVSYFRWKWPTFPPMEGECGLPRSLQWRVNVVNYDTRLPGEVIICISLPVEVAHIPSSGG